MPFTVEQFFKIFEKYNQSIYPIQILLLLGALATVLLAVRRTSYSDQIISGFLGFLWLWMGIIYHLIFFTEINPAAYLFGIIFTGQGLLFLHRGLVGRSLKFEIKSNLEAFLGAIIIVYALVIYPLISYFSGHIFPASPTFGAPCPTTIFTLGLMIWTNKDFPLYLLIIPILWAIVGSSAAWIFEVKEDFGLIITAMSGTFFIIRRNFLAKKEISL